MKKWITWMLAIVLCMTMGSAAMAAEKLLPVTASGSVVSVTDKQVLMKEANGKELVLSIGTETFIIDATTGARTTMKDRKNDTIVAYCSAAQTMSLPPIANAYMIVCNVPADYVPPFYAEVESVKKSDENTLLTIKNGTLIVTLNSDSMLLPYTTRNLVVPDMIKEGSRVAIWTKGGAVASSMPAQATATRLVLFPDAKSNIAERVVNVTTRSIHDSKHKIDVRLPVFSVPKSKTATARLNKAVTDFYNEAVKEQGGNHKLDIYFEKFESTRYVSVVMYKELSAGNTGSSEVKTLVFEKSKLRVVEIGDIIGEKEGRARVNEQILSKINKEPSKFFRGDEKFKEIAKNQSFYFDNSGQLCVLFDKYEISYGSMGNPVFQIRMAQPRK